MRNLDLAAAYASIYESQQVDELYVGKHGQTEKQYQDDRSDAGKMISGDSKGSGANYAYKAKNTGTNPAGGSKRPQGQARMGAKDREYLKYRKAMMNKEEVEIFEGKKDACYHKVKSRYSVWPSAYASGALVKCRKAGAKNWGNSPKKEELEMVFAFLMNEGYASTEDDALAMIEAISDNWFDSIMEELLDESDFPMRDAMNAAGMNRAPKAAPIKPTPKKPVTSLPKKGMA